MAKPNKNLLMGLYFFPRGGSAHVGKYLTTKLQETAQWKVRLATGSLGSPSEQTNAQRFYGALAPAVVDYTSARAAWQGGMDPMEVSPPMHPSYEDKHGVPDKIFARVSPSVVWRQIDAWESCLREATLEFEPSLLHLHHLTPMHEAARRLWPNVPIVTHLHGTELKMLRAIADEPGEWPFGGWWASELNKYAAMSSRFVTVSEQDRHEAEELVVTSRTSATTIPNGVDTELFAPRVKSPDERLKYWHKVLIDEPRGWVPGGEPGSIRYANEEFTHAFGSGSGPSPPILICVGRFTAFKRLDVLLQAYKVLESQAKQAPPLVIWGGFPGEWENEHPYTLAQQLNLRSVFFAGWRGHEELRIGLNHADLFVAPAVNEPFGQVYLEAMSSGIPVIATSTGGPASFVNIEEHAPNGWLVPPGNSDALAGALEEAIRGGSERSRRGENAREFVVKNYSWSKISELFVSLYEEEMRPNDRHFRMV